MAPPERFLRESAVGKRIEHPNVIRLLDAGEIDGRPYIALEFVVGQTLDALRLARADKRLAAAASSQPQAVSVKASPAASPLRPPWCMR